MAKIIKLTQGCYTHVDDDVFEWASKFKWFASYRHGIFYAVRRRNRILHREILGAKPGEHVDHIDGNGLNNLRSNLRICTPAENRRNQQLNIKSTSGLKGVSWHKQNQKYQARIGFEGRPINLGSFDDRQEAGMAYDRAAMLLHGEFARFNFPGAHHP